MKGWGRKWVSARGIRVLGSLLLLASTLLAQDSSGKKSIDLFIHQVEYSDYPEIHIYFSVFNVLRIPVVGLKESAFTLLEDGKPIQEFQVSSAEATQQKLSIAILVDESGSMAKEGKLNSAREALKAFLQNLDPRAELFLFGFHDGVETLYTPEQGREALNRAVNAFSPRGSRTVMYDALNEGLKQVAARGAGRKALVLLTDGKDEGSATTLEDIARLASDLGIPIFSLAYGSDADVPTLQRLTILSGGHLAQTSSPSGLKDLYFIVAQYLASQYALTYVTNAKPGPGKHAVLLKLTHGGLEYTATREFPLPIGLQPKKPVWVAKGELKGKPTTPSTGLILTLLTFLAVGGFFAALLILRISKKAVRKCPTCGNRMEPSWTECMFCKKEKEKQKEEKIPVMPQWQAESISKTLVFKREKTKLGVLRFLTGPSSGKELLLELPKTVVGSGSHCDLVVDDPNVASEHFILKKEGEGYILQDLGSEVGTYVNGTRLEGRRELHSNDRIKIGATTLLFKVVESLKTTA